MRSVCSASRPVVGSSKIRMRGRAARTDATATRWRSPLVSENGSSFRTSGAANPTASSASATRRSHSSGGKPRLRMPNATSSPTVSAKI